MKWLILPLLWCAPSAMAADLLNMAPPCPQPADLAAGGADLDPAREAASGIAAADISPAPPVNLDVPLYLPQTALHGASGAAQTSGAGSVASPAPTNSPNAIVTDIPVGGVAIRDNKVVSVQAMGQEYINAAPGLVGEGAPGCRR